ncbi:hypothetical protein JB92DRAFT_3131343 [Gautieria morchelliformis]|nr:hypothetical protein JB92DRAFT_3131343 [Gautieria morchelliformis]
MSRQAWPKKRDAERRAGTAPPPPSARGQRKGQRSLAVVRRAMTIVPEGGRRQERRAPDNSQDSEYSSSSRKSSRAHAIDHETAEALNKQVQAALHRSTLTHHKHDQLASQLDNATAALMAIGKELHQAEEIRLQDAATLEDVQKALRPCGERNATRPSSRQSAANERSGDARRNERDKQRMPPPAVPVEQDVRFGNEPQEQPAAPTNSRKTIQQIVRDQVASEPDSETTTESLELEVAHWQRKEATATRHHTWALKLLVKNVEETVAHSHTAQLPDEQLTQAAQNAPDPKPDPGPGPIRAYNSLPRAASQPRERSMAPTEGQGIPDQADVVPMEPYDGITRMIRVALADAADTDPEKSVLAKAGVKLAHPKPYAGGSDLEDFEIFVAAILRWLKMNCLLGPTSIDMQFDAVMQGMKTVQEMLNELTKYAARMIQPPDEYTFRRRATLETAQMIEEASRYNMGMRRAESAAAMASAARLTGSKPLTQTGLTRPSLFPRSGTGQRIPPSRPAQAGRPPEAKQPQASGSSPRPAPPTKTSGRPNDRPSGSQNNTACFECGQPGHKKAECPRLRSSIRTAAVRHDGEAEDPETDPDQSSLQQIDEEGEGDPQPNDTPDNGDAPAEEWDPEPSQYYEWDEEVEDTAYRSSAIIFALEDETAMKVMAARTSVTPDKAAEPVYHHRSKHRTRPTHPRSENRTLSGDEDILPGATNRAAASLHRQPFHDQHGMNTTIKFGRGTYDEYFDVENVEYCDAILGTPFLRRFGITLDFSSPGTIRKGNEVIPTGKVSFDDDE